MVSVDVNKTFPDFFISDSICKSLAQKSITILKPIQSATIPLIQMGLDVLVGAERGSGKTIAYLITLLDFLENVDQGVPKAVVILPTLDLAKKVRADLRFFIQEMKSFKWDPEICLWMDPCDCVLSYEEALPDFVISTLECALACLREGLVRFQRSYASVSFLVIDGIDELLLNNWEDLCSFMTHIPKSCQRLFISDDPRVDVKTMKPFFRQNPYITTASEGHVQVRIDPFNCEQYYVLCRANCKFDHLFCMLHWLCSDEKMLIFTNSVGTCFKIKFFVNDKMLDLHKRWKAEVLHASLPENERLSIIKDFNDDVYNILIVDGVNEEKRKLDIFSGTGLKNLKIVLHFEMPKMVDQYMNRIEHAGKNNILTCYSLIYPEEWGIVGDIKSRFEDSFEDEKTYVKFTLNTECSLGNYEEFFLEDLEERWMDLSAQLQIQSAEQFKAPNISNFPENEAASLPQDVEPEDAYVHPEDVDLVMCRIQQLWGWIGLTNE